MLYIFIIWIAIVAWVIKDITNRTQSVILQVFCILLVVLLPFVGIFLYLLIRPGNTLLEKHYAEIEENLEIMTQFIITQEQTEAKVDEKKYSSKSEKKKQKKKQKQDKQQEKDKIEDVDE